MIHAGIQARHPPDPGPARELPAPGPGSEQFMTALATEHFTLQTARASTVSEAGARSALFMSTVSSFVVALALVGSVTEIGATFHLFALALMPVLFALGMLTYLRLSETAIEDAYYGRAINRIRHYYVELDPERAGYLAQSDRDDMDGVMVNSGHPASISALHLFSHTSTMVLVVTAVIAGVGLGLLLGVVVDAGVAIAATVGALVTVALVLGLLMHELRAWQRSERQMPTLFPSVGTEVHPLTRHRVTSVPPPPP